MFGECQELCKWASCALMLICEYVPWLTPSVEARNETVAILVKLMPI